MKSLLASLFLLLLAGVSRADNILIYSGAISANIQVTGSTQHVHLPVYSVFDLSGPSITYNDVLLISTKAPNKTYTTGTSSCFTTIVRENARVSKTIFYDYSSTELNSGFLNVIEFSGVDALLNLGGTFTGTYPRVMHISQHIIVKNSAPTSGEELVANGSLPLNVAYTKQANDANDDLDQATQIVTDALDKAGYTTQ